MKTKEKINKEILSKIHKIVQKVAYSAGDSLGLGYKEYEKQILQLISKALDTIREEGWRAGHKQTKEDYLEVIERLKKTVREKTIKKVEEIVKDAIAPTNSSDLTKQDILNKLKNQT